MEESLWIKVLVYLSWSGRPCAWSKGIVLPSTWMLAQPTVMESSQCVYPPLFDTTRPCFDCLHSGVLVWGRDKKLGVSCFPCVQRHPRLIQTLYLFSSGFFGTVHPELSRCFLHCRNTKRPWSFVRIVRFSKHVNWNCSRSTYSHPCIICFFSAFFFDFARTARKRTTRKTVTVGEATVSLRRKPTGKRTEPPDETRVAREQRPPPICSYGLVKVFTFPVIDVFSGWQVFFGIFAKTLRLSWVLSVSCQVRKLFVAEAKEKLCEDF